LKANLYDGTLYEKLKRSINQSQFHRIFTPTTEGKSQMDMHSQLPKVNFIGVSGRQEENARNKTIEEPILMLNHFLK
jgi:hypothetical protein